VEFFMVGRRSAARSLVVRIISVLLLGAAVAGCDRCGDLWFPRLQMQVCKDQPPRAPQ
jgi:hypothetical protein